MEVVLNEEGEYILGVDSTIPHVGMSSNAASGSRIHVCTAQYTTLSPTVQAKNWKRDDFVEKCLAVMSKVGHATPGLQALALIMKGDVPMRMILIDFVVPCYREMVSVDDEGWGALRHYLRSEGKLTDLDVLVPFAVGPLVGKSLGGAASIGYTISRGATGPPKPCPQPSTQERKEKRPKQRGNFEGGVGVARRETGEVVLKHLNSESEMDDDDDSEGDGDYEEDGFVVDDDDIEYETDASTPMAHYELSDG
jgi:hypothetical protein